MSDSKVKEQLQKAQNEGKKALLTFKDNTTDQKVYVKRIMVRPSRSVENFDFYFWN